MSSSASAVLMRPPYPALIWQVRQQEVILVGFQKENERLSAELRACKEGHRAEAARRDEEISQLRLRISDISGKEAARAPDGLREQLEAAHARAAVAEEERAEREAELRFEVDRLRAAKRELEGRLAGVDVDRMASENSQVR